MNGQRCFALTLLCGLAVVVDGVEGDEKALVKAGRTALNSLTPLAPGTKRMSYFGIRVGPDEAIGYVIASLEAVRDNDKTIYRYATDTGITFPNGTRAHVLIEGRLRPNFEPLELQFKRTMIKREGERQDVAMRAVVRSDKVILSAEQNGQKVSREVPLPERPFIYGIETLVQLLDYDTHRYFLLWEFDIQTGGAGKMTVATETWDDGTPTVVTRYIEGEQTYRFWFDEKGDLLRWIQPSLPVMFVRTGQERAAWLKARFNEAFIGAGTRPEP